MFLDRKRKNLRQYSLVGFDFDSIKDEFAKKEYLKVFKEDEVYIYFGEIPNMPGYCIVLEYKTGKIISGCDIGNFKEILK